MREADRVTFVVFLQNGTGNWNLLYTELRSRKLAPRVHRHRATQQAGPWRWPTYSPASICPELLASLLI